MPPSPLSDVRVVEIGDRIATAYCGKLLRDAGAEVVMAEPPEGSALRRHPLFAFLAGGKQSHPITDELLNSADIVILGTSPAQAINLGITPEHLPGTVVSISDFGWDGTWAEYPATEFTLQAWCGSTGSRGEPHRPPVAVGGDVGEFVVGSYAAFFALADYHGSGGRHLDLSALEAMTASMQVYSWLRNQLMVLTTTGRSIEVPSIERVQDGYVGISMATGQQWKDFCTMVGCPDLSDHPDLQFQHGRWKHRDLVRARTASWFASHTVTEIVRLAERFRIPMAQIGNGESLPKMDHFVQRGVFVQHPAGFRQPRTPWLMSEAAPLPPALPPVLGESGTVWPQHATPAKHANGPPLQGVRIVDLTAFWAGPTATHLMAALGADVVKVESVQHPDGIRFAGGRRADVERWWEFSWVFHGVNSDKRSITLDLASDSGRTLFGRLVAGADVVLENFTPRVMDNFGLDYPTLKRFNDDIVVVRMPAFGLDGPWRDRGGFAMTMEQIAGLAWLTGHPDEPPTAPRGACDPLAGIHAAFTTVAALEYRRRTGHGQLVEIPMVDVVLNASALQVIEHDISGKLLTRRGNRGHQYAVQNVYACADGEQWLALSIRNDDDWAALAETLGRPEWATGAACATEAARWTNADLIDEHLCEWFATAPLDATVADLIAAGIPAAPVVKSPAVLDNPVLKARNFFQLVEHTLCGMLPYPRPPVAGLTVGRPAPLLGEHNAEVLGALGLIAQEIADLEADGVIGSRPIGL